MNVFFDTGDGDWGLALRLGNHSIRILGETGHDCLDSRLMLVGDLPDVALQSDFDAGERRDDPDASCPVSYPFHDSLNTPGGRDNHA